MKKIFSIAFFVFVRTILAAQINNQEPPPPPPPPPPPVLSDSTSAPAYTFAETMPKFPGAEHAFSKYLADNIKYPPLEREAGKQGTVYISFIVEKDGSITDVHAVKEVPMAPGLSKESIRVISQMPNWTPGTMAGKPVRVQVTQPVRFVLQGETKPIVCGINKSDAELGYVATANPGRVPEYVGGYDSLQKRILVLESKLKADQENTNDKTIMFSFIVDTSGQVVNLGIEKTLPGDEKMVLMIAQSFCSMPKWNPGGTGVANVAGSRNANVKLYAEIYLGTYKKRKILKHPNIVIENLGTPPAPQLAKKITVKPVYYGGDSAMQIFLKKNIVYPSTQKKSKKEIIVPVSFIVENDGSLSYLSVSDDVVCAQEFKDEAMRVVKSMPKWTPGTINARSARFPMTVDVVFKPKG